MKTEGEELQEVRESLAALETTVKDTLKKVEDFGHSYGRNDKFVLQRIVNRIQNSLRCNRRKPK